MKGFQFHQSSFFFIVASSFAACCRLQNRYEFTVVIGSNSGHWQQLLLINSADPQSRPVVITIIIHVFRRPSVLTSQNLKKQNDFQVRIVIALCEIVGLAKAIIDDTFLGVQLLLRI